MKSIINKWKESLVRKRARRITKDYPPIIETFHIEDVGDVQFANWSNPLSLHLNLDSRTMSQSYSFFKKFIKKGDLVIDIGANIGDTTVPMGLCAGADGLTIGFDPNPYVFKILQKNSTLNSDECRIEAIPYAITDREEEFYFVSSEASFGNGGISKEKKSKHGKFVAPDKIKGVNLSSFLNENYNQWLGKLSFIKVDAEGYDKEILKSISGLITKYRPVIVAECFGGLSNDEKMELYEVIDNFNYEIFRTEDLDSEAVTTKIESKRGITNWKETINIFAIPKNK